MKPSCGFHKHPGPSALHCLAYQDLKHIMHTPISCFMQNKTWANMLYKGHQVCHPFCTKLCLSSISSPVLFCISCSSDALCNLLPWFECFWRIFMLPSTPPALDCASAKDQGLDCLGLPYLSQSSNGSCQQGFYNTTLHEATHLTVCMWVGHALSLLRPFGQS